MDANKIATIIKSNQRVVPVGGRSKWTASAEHLAYVTPIDMTQMRGIVEYEADEFTLTARAGTTIAEIAEIVGRKGQYLPFDPLLVAAGATLGGSVAANTSGSGRFRYGGMRDFILGITFVDGMGNIVRGGGKVVKNASGFDLPKFMVGSLGRYGILTDITIKVFPKPAAFRTLELTFDNIEDALNATFALANQPFEMDGFDFRQIAAAEPTTTCWIRLGGLEETLPDRLDRLTAWLEQQTVAQRIQRLEDDVVLWAGLNGVTWSADAPYLVKVPVPPRKLLALHQSPAITNAHYLAAGNSALVTTNHVAQLDATLTDLKLNGLVLRGDVAHPHLGRRTWLPLAQRVKQALDPHNKFLEI